jgi:GNAT superfamily N-acetyltransferase
MSNPTPRLITPAHPEDAPTLARFNQLLALETESLQLDPATVLSGVRHGLERYPEARYLVARETPSGPVLGQLMLTREWSDWRDGWVWWIQSVYVEQAHRRRGIMRALFQTVMDMARGPLEGDRVVLVRLYVEEHNHPAQSFYSRIGMANEGYQVWAWKPR